MVLPGGASLDHLGVQFGSLNFMAGDSGEPASAPAAAEPMAASLAPVAETKLEAPPVAGDFDAFHSHALAGAGAYGLSGARPAAEDASHGLAYGASPPSTMQPGYSSLYALDSHQRTAYPYTTPTSGASGLRSADERSAGTAATGPLTPGVGAAPTQLPAPAAPEPQAGMQQPFPNVMPYYYPYYMPNQFQHFSPAAGFGQYPLYGGQPQQQQQQQPSKPDAAAGLQAYAHDTASTPYGTHTPPQVYQPTPGGAMPTYESQGFAQRLGGTGAAAGASDFKLAGTDANGALPSLGFLGAGPPPGVPAAQGRSPNVSSPLDYRTLEAGKGSARPAGASGAGAVPPPSGMPTPQGQQVPMAQQHPAYYQQYAGFNQANAYDGYSYRQPYWG